MRGLGTAAGMAAGVVMPEAGKEPPSFEDVVDELSPPLRRYLERMTGDPTDADDLLQNVLIKIARGLGPLIESFGAYQVGRNEALLDHGMELGEYFYIHALAYHSWLGHSPSNGPWTLYDMDDSDGNARINIEDQEFGQEASTENYNRTMRALLRNQRAALPPVGTDEDLDEMRRRLDGEIEELDDDWERTAWADGLPAVTVACFEPYRARFEDSYDPVTNAFDLWIDSD